METVTVCIATYGDQAWRLLAAARAIPSARTQRCEVIVTHGETLAGARNEAAASATGDLLVFLDADDELAPGYADAMGSGWGGLRTPTLVEVDPDGTETTIDLSRRDMEHLNRCPIGTAISRETFHDLGGFPEFDAWEDWALFLRAYRRGAAIAHIPAAIYRAHVRPDSRNRTVTDSVRLHRRIRAWA